MLRRALVVRRFQSLSVQDICQFVIIGLLTGCAMALISADEGLHALQACVPLAMQAALCTPVLLIRGRVHPGASGSSAAARTRSRHPRTRLVRGASLNAVARALMQACGE